MNRWTTEIVLLEKAPHPIARIAYQLALQINPNNHALDGGIASSAMEKKAIEGISTMFGLTKTLGHLTSGGTMANLEALWIAGREEPKKAIAASAQSHYTHNRISNVLGLPFKKVPNDYYGRLDINSLEQMLSKGDIGTVVVTMGNTGFGSIDPLYDVVKLQEQYSFRIHVDAAYGGYFILDDSLKDNARCHFESIQFADSIVVDPHKHGLQPYGCGCVLFADPDVGRHYKHDSPYTYFTSKELHLGEISLECSRAGASAVSLWATMQAFPLTRGGAFSNRLARSRKAARRLVDLVLEDDRYLTAWEPDLDIVVWVPNGKTAIDISNTSQKLFDRCAVHNIHLALFKVPTLMLAEGFPQIQWNMDTVTCLRACLMKPEHLQYLDEIWMRINRAANEVII